MCRTEFYIIFNLMFLYQVMSSKFSLLCKFVFGLEDIVADIRILETGSNICALG